MSNLPVRQDERVPVARTQQQNNASINEILQLANALSTSGQLPDLRDQGAAVFKMMVAQGMGLPPVFGLRGIYVVKGTPAISSGLIASLVKMSGRYDYEIEEFQEDGCTVRFYDNLRKTNLAFTFNKNDATRAGLLNNGPWKQFPRAMYFARTISMGARAFCPEVFFGCTPYTPEELGGEPAPEDLEVGGYAPSAASTASTAPEKQGGGIQRPDPPRKALVASPDAPTGKSASAQTMAQKLVVELGKIGIAVDSPQRPRYFTAVVGGPLGNDAVREANFRKILADLQARPEASDELKAMFRLLGVDEPGQQGRIVAEILPDVPEDSILTAREIRAVVDRLKEDNPHLDSSFDGDAFLDEGE